MSETVMHKDLKPDETVRRIKLILQELGIKTKEVLFNHGNIAYSCRVTIDDPLLSSLDIGTNGKGLSPDFALASGYAEFMERLQNKFLINEAMRFADKIANIEPLPFRFYPDEQMTEKPIGEFCKMLEDLFPNNYCNEIHRRDDSLKKCSKIKYRTLDYILLSGTDPQQTDNKAKCIKMPAVIVRANSSTGMCAGNSPSEAILQGICEIFERYVLQQIYLRPLTPPSYPKDHFLDSEAGRRLALLEQEGYSYDIKDMSLGQSLPVIGLILTNLSSGLTMVRLGCDPDSRIALERCITEIFQGDQSLISDTFIDYLSGTPIKNPDKERERFRIEYRKSLRDGSGRYPEYMFGNNPTYPLSDWSWKRENSIQDTFRNVVSRMKSMGLDLLVRDNSIFGFNTYHVFIPGYSEQDYRLMPVINDYFTSLFIDPHGCGDENVPLVWPLYNLKGQQNTNALMDLIKSKYVNENTLKLAAYNVSPSNRVNKNLLMFLIAVKGKQYDAAQQSYQLFIKEREDNNCPYDEYLDCVGHYIACMASNADCTAAILSRNFSSDIVNEVLSDFSDPSKVMDNFKFPTCFNCGQCPIAEDCRIKNVIELERKMQEMQIMNPIDQLKLSKLI